MAKAIFKVFIKIFKTLARSVLSPFLNLILSLIPSGIVQSVFVPVSNLLEYLKQFVPFALSYLGLSSELIAIIVLVASLTITIPIAVHGVKLALRWYRSLMP